MSLKICPHRATKPAITKILNCLYIMAKFFYNFKKKTATADVLKKYIPLNFPANQARKREQSKYEKKNFSESESVEMQNETT